ncbi:MAG: helix-turn-helix domain-containing protein [Chloroflexi bacterium]|nr:helix-turn-helix domain-containing protein [Chloroflexota bacterium]
MRSEQGDGPQAARAAQRRPPKRRDPTWDADAILRLRRHMRLTQAELAEELNARQQTVSEWETGRYRPRGPSSRLLTLIAEQAGFAYRTSDPHPSAAREAGGAERAETPPKKASGPPRAQPGKRQRFSSR